MDNLIDNDDDDEDNDDIVIRALVFVFCRMFILESLFKFTIVGIGCPNGNVNGGTNLVVVSNEKTTEEGLVNARLKKTRILLMFVITFIIWGRRLICVFRFFLEPV